MAPPDPDDGAIVISVVYDGPPEAGKTTSIRALARGFGREVHTPEERDGRTVFFDWMEHVGGRFEGAPIRCRIASVPGQRRWRRRREHLLAHADAVVFVGDTSAAGWPASVTRLRELRSWLDGRPGLPVGVVFQANKRDAADAVADAVLTAELADDRLTVVEAVAADGTGVREAFVFAVRLALDRVRAELAAGGQRERASFGQPDELLGLLRGLDGDEAPVRAPEAPVGPRADVPSGWVWPPIEGRVWLREATAGAAARWRTHSEPDAVHDEIDEGRAALVAWARAHAALQPLLSRRRCLVLADDGGGRVRLWQLVRHEPTLLDGLRDAGADPDRLAGAVLGAVQRLDAADAGARAAGVPLPCTLATVGADEVGRPIYVGLVPSRGAPAPAPATAEVADAVEHLLAEATPAARAAVARALSDRTTGRPVPAPIAALMARLAAR